MRETLENKAISANQENDPKWPGSPDVSANRPQAHCGVIVGERRRATSMKEMRESIVEMRAHMDSFGVWSKRASVPFFLWEKTSPRYTHFCLYLLFDRGRVVYAGVTVDIRRRLREHRVKKRFDKVAIQPLAENYDVNCLPYEEAVIVFFSPDYNNQR